MSQMEEHIIVGRDRYITVPDSLKKIAVQYDHNIETVTFDCPRYWDDLDLSKMKIYINYMRYDGVIGSYLCEDVQVDSSDNDILHFEWVISGHVTEVNGTVTFLVCMRNVDGEGNLLQHWNSELNMDMYVSEGLKCQESILRRYPDIITQLLTRMETVEVENEKWKTATYDELHNHLLENEKTALSYMETSRESAESALESANAASESAAAAAVSEANASESATQAANSAIEAKQAAEEMAPTISGMVSAEVDAVTADLSNAINDVRTDLTELKDAVESGRFRTTLTAGETTVTITDEEITENSMLSFYTSIYGVNPKTVEVVAGSVTLTFAAQEVDMEVGVRIDG